MGHCDLRPNKALNQDLYDGAKEMCARPIAIFYGLLYDSRRTRATACGCCQTGGTGVAFWATWTKTENEQPLPRRVTIFKRAVKEIAEFYRPGRQDQMVGGYETSSSSKNRLFEWKFDRIRLVEAVSSSSQWNMDFRLFRTIGLDFLSEGRESFLEPPTVYSLIDPLPSHSHTNGKTIFLFQSIRTKFHLAPTHSYTCFSLLIRK